MRYPRYDEQTGEYISEWWREVTYNGLMSHVGEILVHRRYGSYSGDHFYLLRRRMADDARFMEYGWVVVGFGSCSACDALEGCDSEADVLALAERIYGRIRWFFNKEDLIDDLFDRDHQGEFYWYSGDVVDFVRAVLVEFKMLTPSNKTACGGR